MNIIYRYEDINNIKHEYTNLLRDEFVEFYESLNSEKSIYEFTIEKYGVIIFIDDIDEFEELVVNKTILDFKGLEISEVEEWIFELGRMFVIKFISSDDKLVEVFLEQKLYNLLSNLHREQINKNIRVRRRFDGSKQICR